MKYGPYTYEYESQKLFADYARPLKRISVEDMEWHASTMRTMYSRTPLDMRPLKRFERLYRFFYIRVL